MNGGPSFQGSPSTATTKTMTSQTPAASRMGAIQQPYTRRTPKRKAKLESSVVEPVVVSALDFRVPSFDQPMTGSLGTGPAVSPLPSSPHATQSSKDKIANTKNIQATAASSFPSPPADSSFAHFSKNPAVIQAETPKAPALDMNTVKTKAPRNPQPRTEPRAFGLQEAPTFYPTWDEFKDPMAYVAKIVSEYGAEKYGIAKIVPPNGWQPPFVLDTERFRFKTRLMRLNSIEAKSRAKINFFEQLVMFHQQQGNPRLTVPVVDHKDVDLWLLRKEVNRLGGYEQVTKSRNWAEIARAMGTSQPFAYSIRNVYARIILPFEQYVARAKNARSPPKPSASTSVPSNNLPTFTSTSNVVTETPFSKAGNGDKLPPTPVSTGGRPVRGAAQKKMFSYDEDGDSSLSEPDSDTDADLSRPVTAPPLSKLSSLSKKEIPIVKGEQCEICRSGAHGTKILLCDGCDRGYHIYCLDPPLSAVPKNESWFCSVCLMNAGAEFGFDEGEEHSLSSFQARDTAFRNHWWATHPPKQKTQPPVPLTFAGAKPILDNGTENQPNGETQKLGGVDVSEHDVEMEFWRLVESQTETVEVEYGADVHVMLHGSGAPTTETHPLEPYSVDQWNLNVMPIVPDSVLRYIKTNISGMTVPWIYVGFVFSAFCWHNEDHHTSSINYMHWGETKTWYGVPGEYSSAFEEAMKSEAPDLFEQQPSLLFQLVTLMNPGRINKAGVPVYACDQRPNEFVVTFPRAYHAGFNHGLNYNEAVNFAHPEWLEHGLGCVQNYKKYNKPPVFSHDELLVSIATHSKSIKTAIWLKPHIEEMVARELKARGLARIQLSTLASCKEEIQSEDLPEEEYQCSSCKAYCYLAQIRCPCTKEIACLDHATELCQCDLNKKSLRLRFTDDALVDMEKQISDRAAIPEVWKAKLVSAVFESKRPSLRQLRTLVAEGKQISHTLPDLAPLEVFVERANEMVVEASSFTVRKLQSRKPSRKSRSVGIAAEEDLTAGEEFTSKPGIDAVVDLLSQVETLGFEAPEITALENFLATAVGFQYRATNSLSIPDEQQSITDCEALFNSGLALGLNLPELQAYSCLVHRLRWVRDLEEVDETTLEMKDIDTFIERAQAYQVRSDHPFVLDLQAKKVSSHSWAGDADQILGSTSADMADLEALLARSRSVAVDADRLHRLQLLRSRVMEAERNVRSMLDSLASSRDRISVTRDAQRLINRFEAKGRSPIPVSGMEELRNEVSAYSQFFDEVNTVIKPELNDKSLMEQLHALLVNVNTRTDPADDLPLSLPTSVSLVTNTTEDASMFAPFACVCRLPQGPDMISCTRCAVAYHSACVESIQADAAKEPYLCLVCEPYKVDLSKSARLILADLSKLVQPEFFTFRHPPPEFEMLSTIVNKTTRFADFLTAKLRSISPRTTSNVEEVLLLRHFLRKVEGLWVDIQTSYTGDKPVSLRPAIIATLTALEKNEPAAVVNPASTSGLVSAVFQEKKRVRNRKPKWEILHETPPHDQGCICRLSKEETIVTCSNARCARGYHPSCAFIKPADFPLPKFKCPLCCIQTGTRYKYAICLLQMKEHEGTRQFVNVKATLNALDTLIFLDLEILEGRPYIVYIAKTFHPGFRSEIEEGTEPPPVKRKKPMVESLGSVTNSPVGEAPPTRSVPPPTLPQIVPPPLSLSSSSFATTTPTYIPPPFSPSCFQPPPPPPPPSYPPSYYPSHPFSSQSYLTYQALPPPSSVPPRFYSSHSQYYPPPPPALSSSSLSSSSELSHLLNPIQEPLPSPSILLPPTPVPTSLVTPALDSIPIPTNLPAPSELFSNRYQPTGHSIKNSSSDYQEPDSLPLMKKAETETMVAGPTVTATTTAVATLPTAMMSTPAVEVTAAAEEVAFPPVSPATEMKTSESFNDTAKSSSETILNGSNPSRA